jgi:methionine biosynthesis protein MetW
MTSDPIRLEHRLIAQLVETGASVLDLGCGEGELLSLLVREKRARVQGIEIDQRAIRECVAHGLSVFHGDIDAGLSDYADASFDYVIVNQTLPQVRHPDTVLQEALRVGRQAIVGFANFAHYAARAQLFFRGRAPITPSLPYHWYDSPNLHFLSIADFVDYTRSRDIEIMRSVFVGRNRRVRFLPNLLADVGIFLLRQGEKPPRQGSGP